MTIRIATDQPEGQTTITFTLTADAHDGPVSVVGSFNDWDPHRNPLLPDEDGNRSTSIAVDTSHTIHFRYLGADGVWFDDPDADEITTEGGVVHLVPDTSASHTAPTPPINSAEAQPPKSTA